MDKRLFFICPTDYIETVINRSFAGDNYFITSLGNSVTFNERDLREIISFIIKNDVSEISFVLSYDNIIFRDAIENGKFSGLVSLKSFYQSIYSHKMHSESIWEKGDIRMHLLSKHLIEKIKKFESSIQNIIKIDFKLSGKVYMSSNGIFYDISPGVIFDEPIYLN